MGVSMTKVMNLAKRFAADEEGAALIEYTVLLGIMMVAVIATILAVGNWVNTKWTALNTNLAKSP
jgi:pilus assembly protein Flp/PilA